MPSNRLILRKMGSPWRTQHSDITRGTTLTHADLDNNFIFLKGEVIDSARLDGETLKLTKICGADIELNLSALTQTNEDSLRVLSDTSDEIKNNFNTDVTNINTTINEFKSDVENNSVWEWVDNRKNEVKIKGSGNTDTIVYAPKLNINIEPANDNSLTQVLVRDDNGNVKYKDIKSFTDLNVVSGVYDIKSGIVKLTNNEGGSFEISGFTSGMTDSYTDEAYLKGNTIYFNSNIKGDDIYSVDISPILDDVINSVGYNDRGECSLKSYTEYEHLSHEYTKIKKVYDELQSNKQQLEDTIADLQSQLFDVKNQNPVNEELVNQLEKQIKQNQEDLAQTNAQIKEIEASGDLEFIIYMPVNEANFNCWLRSEVIKSIGYNDRGECSYKMYALYENLYQKSLKEQESIKQLEQELSNIQEIRNQEHANYISEKNQLENDLSSKQNELDVLKEIVSPTPEELQQIALLEEQIAYIESQLKELAANEVQAVKSYTQNISFLGGQINQWYNTSLRADQSGYEFFQKYTPLNEANFTCWRDIFFHEIQEEQINNIITTIGYNDRGICSLDSFTEYRALAENYTNTNNEYDVLQSYKQDLETNIADLKSQLVNATTQEERDILNGQIQQNEVDLKQTLEQIKEIESSGDLDFVAYIPVNEANFNCWVNAKQTESLSNEINITNNNVTEQVEIINKTINEVVNNIGYNDRGVCSLDSFTEYRALAENYTNTKNEYDALQNSVQQLEVTIADLQSQLFDTKNQNPVNEELVNQLEKQIKQNQEDLKQTKAQIKEIEASGDLDFADYMPVNESNFNCWTNTLQDIRVEEVSKSVEVGNGNITNLFNSYTSTTQTTLGDFDKVIKSNSGDIKEVNELLNEHINDINNPHQTSFDNLTSTAHTHTISDVIGLQSELDGINKSILSIDDVYVNQGSVDALNQKLIFTNTDGGTFEVTNAAALFTDNDIHVVSGLYNPSTGIVTYTTNVGTTFEVSGFAKELTDSYTTAANLNGEIISFDNNVNGDGLYSVDLSTMLQPLKDRLGDLENAEDADTFTESVSLSNNTLTFNRNDSQTYSVDLSPLNSADNDWSVNGNNMYSLPSGNVGIGTNSPQNKLHIEGSGFDNSAIRFLNTAGGFTGNQDYWLMGSRSFSSGADGFEIGRNSETAGGKLYITNGGNVSIGNGTSPTNKLEVAGSTLITNPNSTSDILSVESKYSNLTYGGISGVGNFTNNLILKHKNIGGTSDTSSSIQIRNGGTGDTDKTSIELTTYFNNGGADISYNGLIMNSGGNNVNIISADNDAENAILSIQADESISFQSSIGAGASWPNDSKKTMTIDLTNDKVIVDGGFTLNNGSQGAGKVLVSDDEGNTTWGYYGLKLDYVNVKNISFGSSYNLLENTFTKVLTWETQENNTPDFILPVISSESKGNEVVVKHVGGKQSIVIVAPGVTKIDKYYSSVNITNGDSITFYCDGINWYIKSHYKNIFGDIPGFFYTNDPIGGDTRIYFGSPNLSNIVTSVNIAASSQKVYVHTTNNFNSANVKADDGVAGSNWFITETTGNVAANITSGIDGQEITVYQTEPGDGGTIGFATSDGRASTLTVTTTK